MTWQEHTVKLELLKTNTTVLPITIGDFQLDANKIQGFEKFPEKVILRDKKVFF